MLRHLWIFLPASSSARLPMPYGLASLWRSGGLEACSRMLCRSSFVSFSLLLVPNHYMARHHLTIFANSTSAGCFLSNPYFLIMASKEHSSPWWPNSTFGISNGIMAVFILSCCLASICTISYAGAKINSASLSTKFFINQGHANLSTFACSLVIYFIL